MSMTMLAACPDLRSLTDDELATEIAAGRLDWAEVAAIADRRDRADRARQAARVRQAEWEAAAYAQYLAAEARCAGNLLSEAGKRAGRDAWPMLWQGGEETARKLASEELITFWDYESPRVPGPAAYAAAKRAEVAEVAARQPVPVTWEAAPGGRVRLTSVRCNGGTYPAWWAIDEAGRATLHPSREAAAGSAAPQPEPAPEPLPAPPMSRAAVSRFETAMAMYGDAIDSLTARALAARDAIERRRAGG